MIRASRSVVVGKALAAWLSGRIFKLGTADVGLIVRADAEPLGSVGGFGPAPLLIVADPARGVAVPMLSGQVQKAYFSALPDVALGGVDHVDEQPGPLEVGEEVVAEPHPVAGALDQPWDVGDGELQGADTRLLSDEAGDRAVHLGRQKTLRTDRQ